MLLAAASCSAACMERLGEVNAPVAVNPVLRLATRPDVSRFTEAILNALFVLLNTSSVPDNQPIVCAACLPDIVSCTRADLPSNIQVRV